MNERDWSGVHPACRPKDKPYAAMQVRELVYDPHTHGVIGYTYLHDRDWHIVSKRFKTIEEAEADVKKLNQAQGLALYRVNTRDSKIEEV